MRTVIMVYIIIAILGFTAGVILLCRAMYKSISKRHTENTPGDSNIPGISCVSINSMAAVSNCTLCTDHKRIG